jgi:hypothetical protein
MLADRKARGANIGCRGHRNILVLCDDHGRNSECLKRRDGARRQTIKSEGERKAWVLALGEPVVLLIGDCDPNPPRTKG